jgi:hypothetical protein
VTQSNAACSSRRAPRKGKVWGKSCCSGLAERAVEARARDRGATSAMGLDVLRPCAAIHPGRAARQTQTDLDGVFRPSGEDVDVRAHGTREGHAFPFRVRAPIRPAGTQNPSTARSANSTMRRFFPQEGIAETLLRVGRRAVDGAARPEPVRQYLDAELATTVPAESRWLQCERAQALSVLIAGFLPVGDPLASTADAESAFTFRHAVSFAPSRACRGRPASRCPARATDRAS